MLAKRLTPIERAIAGEPADRRRRYDERMRQKGFKRLTVMVREDDLELLRAVVQRLHEDPDSIQSLRAIVAAAEGTERTERSEGAPRPSARPEERS